MAKQLNKATEEAYQWQKTAQHMAELLASAMEITEVHEVQQGKHKYELDDGHLVITSQTETVH
jgi:2,3-bisphosphoglycerate-independent phosphoglycerate mutase